MALGKVHHVALVVRDAETALKFYQDVFGLTATKDAVIESQGVRGILLPVGDSEIEIIQPVRDDTGVARFLQTDGEGLHHICFQSSSVDADLYAVEGLGAQLIDRKSRPGLAGMIGFIHPRANHGVLVEFAQPPADEAPHHPDTSGGIGATQLDTVTIAVDNLNVARTTYIWHFGFPVTHEADSADRGARCVWLEAGHAVLELVAPLTDDKENPVRRSLARGEGMKRVTLLVANLDKAVAHLRGAGLAVTEGREVGPDGQPARLALVGPEGTYGVPWALMDAHMRQRARDAVAAAAQKASSAAMPDRKIRVLIAKPGLDGHDRGAKVVARALRDAGMEVIYTGIRQTPEMIAEAALQENVDVVGLSILSGAHLEIFPRVVEALQAREITPDNTLLFCGGIIPDEDAVELRKLGFAAVFGPGASTKEIIDFVNNHVKAPA